MGSPIFSPKRGLFLEQVLDKFYLFRKTVAYVCLIGLGLNSAPNLNLSFHHLDGYILYRRSVVSEGYAESDR